MERDSNVLSCVSCNLVLRIKIKLICGMRGAVTHSQDLRKTFYALQDEANVAAGNCSRVVEIVAKHFFNTNLEISDLPSASA